MADPEDAQQQLRKVAADDPDLLLVQTIQTDVAGVAAEHPDTQFVVYDQPSTQPNVTSVVSQDEEGAFLAGAAAALVSQSGGVGFIGGVRGELIERFEAGFTAGARTIDPEIDVLVEYLSTPPDYEGFVSVDRGLAVARQMYDDGADVVFAAAGESGLGVIEAAAAKSTATRHLWAIGVDSDRFETIQWLPGVVEPARWQAHILTSVTKTLHTNIYDVVADHSRGRLEGGVRRWGSPRTLSTCPGAAGSWNPTALHSRRYANRSSTVSFWSLTDPEPATARSLENVCTLANILRNPLTIRFRNHPAAAAARRPADPAIRLRCSARRWVLPRLAQELLKDRTRCLRARLPLLDEHRDRQIALRGDHPRVRVGRGAGAELRCTGLGADRIAGHVG